MRSMMHQIFSWVSFSLCCDLFAPKPIIMGLLCTYFCNNLRRNYASCAHFRNLIKQTVWRSLDLKSTNFVYKDSDSKYFWFTGHMTSVAITPLW